MNTLIIKLNATGDVVRTTPLLHRLEGDISWVTAANNVPLLDGLADNVRCLSWEQRTQVLDRAYDLVINLEDEQEVAAFAGGLRHQRLFGAYLSRSGTVAYTDDARGWFDLSLISVYGRHKADNLKYLNRRAYQELIFEGLGLQFAGETYWLPKAMDTDLFGDVAFAPTAGPVWPMKNWAHYDQLKGDLEATGLKVNILPHRPSLLEHLGDIKNHRCLVGGDSLPMHLALGVGTPCVTIFNCTSPWEIYGYGLQTKIVSPLLGEFFYERGYDTRATTAIGTQEVFDAVMDTVSGRNSAKRVVRP
jgi:ADP-heptose:LPS heptosyltransferase